MTLYEYFQTPETVLPQELIDGVMYVADSPTPIHQRAVGELFLALHEHVANPRIGHVWLAPLDVVLDHEAPIVLQPDLFVILERGKARVADHVYGAPDLVIEVLSPWPRIGDLATRIALFRDHGVRECWLVHQLTGVVEVLTFEDRQIASRAVYARHERIVSHVLPGFDRSLTMMLGYEM